MNELIQHNRCYRRFDQHTPIERKILEQLIELARLSSSSQNLQPLKYFLSTEPQTNAIIFDSLSWAGYLPDWHGPEQGERPAAYVLVLGDELISKSFEMDAGIAAQSIRLGAAEMGLGSCIIGSIKRHELANALQIPAHFKIIIAVPLGTPQETIVLEAVNSANDIYYWRDEAGIHHVPKRTLNELIIN